MRIRPNGRKAWLQTTTCSTQKPHKYSYLFYFDYGNSLQHWVVKLPRRHAGRYEESQMFKKSIVIFSFMSAILCGCDEQDEQENALQELTILPETETTLVNGTSTNFIIRLTEEPAAPVTVNIRTNQPQGIIFNTNSVVFRPDNWQLAQSITATCLSTGITQSANISFSTSSLDSNSANLLITRQITCQHPGTTLDPVTPPTDNPVTPQPDNPVTPQPDDPINPPQTPEDDDPVEKGGVTVKPKAGITTSESGQNGLIAISLSKRPTQEVYITVQSMDESEGIPNKNMATFTPNDWSTPQGIQIMGVDDDELDGNIEYSIKVAITSADPAYDDLDDQYVKATNLDDEEVEIILDGTPGVLVSPVGGLITSEKGATAQFEVVLKGQPTDTVTIPVASSDETEGKPNTKSLIFTTDNWDKKQTVSVQGLDDDEPDGDIAYSIKLGPVSSDDNRYDEMPVTSVNVKNIDNDPPNIPASFKLNTQELTIEESGAPGIITIAPGTKPIEDVTITATSSDTTEGVLKPATLTFTEKNWETIQTISVSGVIDKIEDGTQDFKINFKVTSEDPRFDDYSIQPVTVHAKDSDAHSDTKIHLRIMAANISSGNFQAYSPGHGVRIFKAAAPDIVLIQEFNWNNTEDSDTTAQKLVNTAFGPDFYFSRGTGSIPNGVISRYPILSSGAWDSNIINNRKWDWAVVDLPGPKELLLVSVHLSTDKHAKEMPVLIDKIKSKIEEDAKQGSQYFVMIGGDFNTKNRTVTQDYMSDIFTTAGPYPVDQNGNDNTNTNRNSPYDYLMCSPDWCKYEVPVEIGVHTGANAYKNGHVFDTRVYYKYKVGSGTELDYVPPAEQGDSGSTNMQHMAVIRDFEYTY